MLTYGTGVGQIASRGRGCNQLGVVSTQASGPLY